MKKQYPSFLVHSGNFFFKYRDQLFPVFFISLFVLFPPVYPQGSPFYDTLLDLFALAIAFLGEGFRVVTVGLEYIRRGGLNKQVYADNLVTGGMFAHCRNPLYVGNQLLLLSLLMISDNPWAYLLGGLFTVYVYISIVAAEETFLHQKFGAEYEAYCQQVNRWIPDFRNFQNTLSEMQFNWRRVLFKEYSSVYPWCVGAIVLDLYETLRNGTGQPIQSHLMLLFTLFLLVTAGFIAIRFFKKTGRLTEKEFTLFPNRQAF